MPRSNQREVRDVLVALWPLPGDRRLAERQGWYRMRPAKPVTQLGDLRRFRELLFYQPDSFGPGRRIIEYRAAVSAYELVRRIDLLPDEFDHPRAQQMYHCLRLGPLTRLETPIRSRIGRRILFVPTTAERVASAQDINDLFSGTPPEDLLYCNLRDAGLYPEREYWVDVPRPGTPRARKALHCLDFAVMCRDGNLDVECDGDRWHTGSARAAADRRRDNALTASGWHILRFGTDDIYDRIDETVACVRETSGRYGGPVIG